MSLATLARRAPQGIAALALAAALTGCGGSNDAVAPRPISQQQSNAVAEQLAGLIVLSPDPTQVPTLGARRSGGELLAMRPAGAAPLAMQVGGDLAWEFNVRYYDAEGNEQEGPSDLTARMLIEQRASGSFSSEGFQSTLGHHALLDLSGLLASQAQVAVNATRNDTLTAAYAGPEGEAQLSMLCSGAWNEVRRTKPLEENPYPVSGAARWAVDASRAWQTQNGSGNEEFACSVVVTFNGTRYVPMVVNNQFTYTLDLDTGEVTLQGV